MVGARFGRLTVVGKSALRSGGHVVWVCICDCGKSIDADGCHLRRGKSTSCGCFRAQASAGRMTVHGEARKGKRSRTFNCWMNAKMRCFSPGATRYKDWGGRGITMCERWKNSFENFLADMGECPLVKSLDRIENDGNYEPGNCRWATPQQQNNNRRKVRNEHVRNGNIEASTACH